MLKPGVALSDQIERRPIRVESSTEGQNRVIRLEGDLLRGNIVAIEKSVDDGLAHGGDVHLDMSLVERFDSAGAEFLVRRLKAAEGRLLLRNASKKLRLFLEALPPPEVFKGEMTTFMRPPVADFLVDTATEVVEQVSEKIKRYFVLFFLFVYYLTIGPFRGHKPRIQRTAQEIVLMGIDAIPIVALVSVLMGLILGFQSATQLEKFGGESLYIWSANLVGVSVLTEIGPIMTAILIAGRSGSAITAEIGTMAVTEELDALRVMGMNPIPFLVVPKILGLLIALPCLVMLADIVGVGGGFITGVLILGVPFSEYWRQTQEALSLSDLFTGLSKAAMFGLLIGLTGAVHGLMVRGGSSDVGLKTTTSVVLGIALVISADLLFTMFFFVN